MGTENLYTAITERLESLSAARAEQRKADDEVKRLKVELATLSAKLAATESKVNVADFTQLVGRALDSW